MVFSSATFLFAFLPVSLVVYFLLPSRSAKNVWLFLISLVFYAWGEPVYVLLMLASIFVNWSLALAVDKRDDSDASRRGLFALAVVFNVLVIGFFKYEGFLAQNINGLVGFTLVPDLQLPLPVGISFYTLQALSYVVDVFRREVRPQKNILYLGMYVACFPQLVAGPIVRYQTIEAQIDERRETLEGFAEGIRLFVVGLAKKVLLANVVALLATRMLARGGPAIGLVGAWGGLVAYTFQILFDFSGYSDMAIGLGKMLGFTYLRNFNYPYLSKSATEFWRRWHMSLGSFFRDYVYIPLGGNRCSTGRWLLNILVVWFLTGLWHGAAWHFIAWGLFYGVLLIAEKLFLLKWLERLPAVVQHLYAAVTILFGWLLFWVNGLGELGGLLKAMVGMYGLTGEHTSWELGVWQYLPVFAACLVASTPVVPWVRRKLELWARGEADKGDFMQTDLPSPRCVSAEPLCRASVEGVADPGRRRVLSAVYVAVDVVLLVLLLCSIASIASGLYNPFIYFKF